MVNGLQIPYCKLTEEQLAGSLIGVSEVRIVVLGYVINSRGHAAHIAATGNEALKMRVTTQDVVVPADREGGFDDALGEFKRRDDNHPLRRVLFDDA